MKLLPRPPVAFRRTRASRGVTQTATTQTATRLVGVLAALGLLVLAAPAGAVVEQFGATKVGLQPREVTYYQEGPHLWSGLGTNLYKPEPAVYSFNNPTGAPVLHNVSTYAIFWDPQYFYHDDWAGVIEGYLSNLAHAGTELNDVFAVDAQYTDATNRPAADRSSFLGGYTDTSAYPASEVGCVDPKSFGFTGPLQEVGFKTYESVCLTDPQIQSQLNTFVHEHHLRTGMETIFYVLTPPGVAVCLAPEHCSEFSGEAPKIEEDEKAKATAESKKEVWSEPAEYKSYKNSFCSYHSAIGDGDAETIIYAAIPWTAGGEADPHLSREDATAGYDCQDGGFGPATKPTGELQEKEREKEKSPKEEEEFKAKSEEEKRKQRESEELHLEKPHNQEPNQPTGGKRSPDGGFDTGLADLIVNQIAIEQQNTITDPLLDAWQDSAGKELTDECRNSFFATTSGSVTASPESRSGTLSNQEFETKHYYLNDAFDLASLQLPYPGVPCLHSVMLEPKFTVPNPVNAGEIVGFNGMDSEITLNVADKFGGPKGEEFTYSTYKWNFGDGSPEVTGYAPGAPPVNPPTTLCEQPWLSPCAASAFHSYQYGGTYQVTLTVTDIGGNTASFVAPVKVEGPPPPGGSSGGAPGGASSGGGSPASVPGTTGTTGTAGTTGSTGSTAPPVPGPVAQAAAVATSLKRVAKRGLVVDYSVNEQVAGRFEVLLPASTAHKLGIGGTPASGLPAGFPQSLVIGQALLVTTKGGHSTVRIKFSKRTSKHLRHAHSVTLTLRLKVRNASKSPLFTTVMTTVVLHH